MESTVKEHLLEAIRIMMKPLVRLLINQGVTHSEFSEALKDVYVDSAIRHFGNKEKERVNRSRVAILTGMTRKEVSNVIERAIAAGSEKRVYSRPERVLSGWYSDPSYTGPYGLPLELPYQVPEGKLEEGYKSFVELVATYSGDMSPKAMLEELLRGGSVTEADGFIKAVRRDFEPGGLSSELIVRFGEIGHKFFKTSASNIEKTEQGGGYFDRLVYSERGCTDDVIQKFDAYVKEHGQAFLEQLDNWLGQNEKANEPGQERKETGVYIVGYVESSEEKTTLSGLLTEMGITSKIRASELTEDEESQ